MKRDFRLQTLGVRRVAVVVCLFVTASAFALTAENPYGGIVERNAFALKPPPPPTVAPPPPASVANVELRGITTLLGRPQVLLNFKIMAKPPELPKDRSLVMDVRQREGDVEVLEINPGNGSVRLLNQGTELTLTLKDNAAKPQSAPGLAAPVGPAQPGVKPVPSPIPAPAAPGGNPVSTVGGGVTLPSRSLRANSPTTSGASAGSASAPASQPRELTAEEGAALLEVNRKLHEGKGLPFPPARVNLNK